MPSIIILLPTFTILSPTLRILSPSITSNERDFLARQYWLRRQLLFGIGRILLQIPSANAEGGEVQFKLHTISPFFGPRFAPRRQILLEELDLSKNGNFFDTNIPHLSNLLMTHQIQQTIRAKILSKNSAPDFVFNIFFEF